MATDTLLKVFLLLSVANYGLGQRKGFRSETLKPLQNTHLVRLKISEYGYQIHCSGSIISDRWILTAAYCVQDVAHEENKIMVENRKGQKFQKLADVAEIFLKDPSYDEHIENSPENTEKDLALILTKQVIRFDTNVQPIKVATRVTMVKGDGSAVRYGHSEIKPGYFVPKQGVVQIVTCPSSYKETSLICSDGTASLGDWGGPLVYKGKLIGVMSEVVVDRNTKSKRDNERTAENNDSDTTGKGSDTLEQGSVPSGSESKTSEQGSDTSGQGSPTTVQESNRRDSRTFTVYVNVASNLNWIKDVMSIF